MKSRYSSSQQAIYTYHNLHFDFRRKRIQVCNNSVLSQYHLYHFICKTLLVLILVLVLVVTVVVEEH